MTDKINFETVLHAAAEMPLVKVDRMSFLQRNLMPHFKESVVSRAILTNPAQAGISIEEIDNIAKACINRETAKVTLLSTVAGIPGGLVMVGTAPADLTQYFAHILRIVQELVYLYGWQEIFDKSQSLDDDTENLLMLFIGIMFGVNRAAEVIAKISEAAAKKTAKTLAQKALTKGTIYPIVKKLASNLGIRMTKELFAKGVGKIVPVVGGAISGTITFVTFKPMAHRLKNHLSLLKFADVEFYKANSPDKEELISINDFAEV